MEISYLPQKSTLHDLAVEFCNFDDVDIQAVSFDSGVLDIVHDDTHMADLSVNENILLRLQCLRISLYVFPHLLEIDEKSPKGECQHFEFKK